MQLGLSSTAPAARAAGGRSATAAAVPQSGPSLLQVSSRQPADHRSDLASLGSNPCDPPMQLLHSGLCFAWHPLLLLLTDWPTSDRVFCCCSLLPLYPATNPCVLLTAAAAQGSPVPNPLPAAAAGAGACCSVCCCSSRPWRRAGVLGICLAALLMHLIGWCCCR